MREVILGLATLLGLLNAALVQAENGLAPRLDTWPMDVMEPSETPDQIAARKAKEQKRAADQAAAHNLPDIRLSTIVADRLAGSPLLAPLADTTPPSAIEPNREVPQVSADDNRGSSDRDDPVSNDSDDDKDRDQDLDEDRDKGRDKDRDKDRDKGRDDGGK